MEVTDVEKAKACLSRIGYYRLSAYWYPFRKSQIADGQSPHQKTIVLDDFKAETSFSTILDLYVFDKKLRMLVLDALERIEVAIRTSVALTIGRYSPLAHRDPRYLHGNFARRPKPGNASTKHQDWLLRGDKKFLDSREDFAKHFKNKYPGEYLPIWIDVELWDFGALSHFYSGLAINDRDTIARTFGIPDGRTLETWLRCLNDIRNVCAHHSRLWNKPLVNRPSWPGQGLIPDIDHVFLDERSKTRLYASLIILRVMLKTVNPESSWPQRLIAHTGTLPDSPHITLSSAGFPDNWSMLSAWI